MPKLTEEEKLSVNLNVKPKRMSKKSTTKTEIEFRWSVFASQDTPPKQISILNLHSIDLNQSKKQSPSSSKYSTARSLTTNKIPLSREKFSSTFTRLSNMNKKIDKLSIPNDENNNNTQKIPLSLTYAQLHRTKQLSKLIETSNSNPKILYPKSTSSVRSQQKVTTNKFIKRNRSRLKKFLIPEKR